MKPKRPTETDLLAIVQNGFNAQLPMDRETQASTKAEATSAPEPAPLVPMVRITLAIPEDLRYRLKVALMDHRRKSRGRMTQDDYCAKAICAQLDLEEGGAAPWSQVARLVEFIQDCMREGALDKSWAPKARALLEGVRKAPAT